MKQVHRFISPIIESDVILEIEKQTSWQIRGIIHIMKSEVNYWRLPKFIVKSELRRRRYLNETSS